MDKKLLEREYLHHNYDAKTISERHDISYSSVRYLLHKYRIKKPRDMILGSRISRYKEKTGYNNPSQNNSIRASKIKYEARSGKMYNLMNLRELSYILYLEFNNVEWDYRIDFVIYIDHVAGTSKNFTIDISTNTEWIELKLQKLLVPSDCRMYACRQAKDNNKTFRGLKNTELQQSFDILQSMYRKDKYEFTRYKKGKSCFSSTPNGKVVKKILPWIYEVKS